jgi:hypothetical protein
MDSRVVRFANRPPVDHELAAGSVLMQGSPQQFRMFFHCRPPQNAQEQSFFPKGPGEAVQRVAKC